MDSFNLRLIIAWGFFLAFLIVALYIIVVRKLRKMVSGEEEREAPDFVLENIRSTLDQRKEMSRELAMREQLNASILKNLDLGVAIFDRFKVLKTANPMFFSLFNLAETVLGQSIVQWQDTVPELFNFVKELRHHGDTKEDDIRIPLRGRTVQMRAVPVGETAPEGSGGFLVIAEDITDIESAKMQLELKKRLEIIGEMSAGIAHEFRNALSTVKGYAQMIQTEPDRNLVQEHVRHILSEVDDINTVVNQFLLYAKPLQVVRQLVTGGEISEDIAEQFPEGKHRLRVEIPDDIQLQTDRVLLKQCLVNIIRNSFQHSAENETVQVVAEQTANHIRISIRDNGTGMEPETLKRAVVPFFTTRKDGTGLGLALCEKIVSKLGGTMTIDSAPEIGTTVVIEI